MAQASAQREPSMEEILASIRRIIEDSDTVPKPDGIGAAADDAGDADIDAFLEELGTPASPPRTIVPAPANESAKPPADPGQQTVAPLVVEAVAVPASVSRSGGDAASASGPVTAGKPASSRPEPGPAGADRDKGSAPAVEGGEPHEARPEPAAAELIPHHMRSIVSAETGRQVQAAFGDLNDAFQRSRSKPLDQVAEEMLRPMLQDWLDNNLPTLVERLVREEIERVARGE